MTMFYLIRHALFDGWNEYIAGRRPGVCLNDEGRRQAKELAKRLMSTEVDELYSSPMLRAFETARIIGGSLLKEVTSDDAFAELDYGAWTGRRFASLRDDDTWRRYNSCRSITRIPNGESMHEAQVRFVNGMIELARPNGHVVAIVSHSDPIKSAIAYFLGASLDWVHQIEIAPASVSTVELTNDHASVIGINRC
jgi:probable phosphoglycerate mutase